MEDDSCSSSSTILYEDYCLKNNKAMDLTKDVAASGLSGNSPITFVVSR